MVSEEDIKHTEKFIKAFKTDDTKSVCGFDVQAIERLLQGYKELKELYKSEKKTKIQYVNLYQDIFLKENVIPKSLVEEKIEELESVLDLCEADGKIAKYKIKALKEEITDLEELLKGDK